MRTEDYIRRGQEVELKEQMAACEKRMKRLQEEIRIRAFPLGSVTDVDTGALQQAIDELTQEQERWGQLKQRLAEVAR